MSMIRGWNTMRVQKRYQDLRRMDKKRLLSILSGIEITSADINTPKETLIYAILEAEFGIDKTTSTVEELHKLIVVPSPWRI